MSETATIEATIAGDWRIVAGILTADVHRIIGPDGQRAQQPRSTPLIRGVSHITVYAAEGIGNITADVYLRPVEGATIILVRTHADAAEEWQNRIAFLAEAVGNVAAFEEWERPSAADVIETYYRRKAAGGKVTLKQLAEETGYSMAGLKVAKQRYDKAGGWGSKRRTRLPISDRSED